MAPASLTKCLYLYFEGQCIHFFSYFDIYFTKTHCIVQRDLLGGTQTFSGLCFTSLMINIMALVYRNHELLYQQAYDITTIMDSEVISAAILIVFAHIFISKLILWLQVPILGQPIVLRIEYFTGERHETKIKAPTIKHS